MNNRKILLISNKLMHYRVPVYNYFFEHFKLEGWEFCVIANEIQKNNPHKIDFNLDIAPFNFAKYIEIINRIRPDIIIVFLHLKDTIIWPLVHWAKIKRIPIAFWTKGANLDKPDDRASLFAYKYMHFIFDALILYSKFEKRLIKKRFHKKIFIANNTLNFNDFPSIADSAAKIKKEFSIPFQKYVLAVGRMEEGGGRKKIDHLIEAFREITEPGLGLVIVGSGMTPALRSRMNSANTLYLGEIYDPSHIKISKLFKAADIFSLPGHLGLGINQAFYWSLPVITEHGLHPPEANYLVDGRNGFIVPENDIKKLKEKILLLLKNDNLRKQMAENARHDILKYANIDGMFNGFLKCVTYLYDKKKND